jgi:hypothetical protein
LTGLQVDEIIRLFGWMVAINPLGQVGGSSTSQSKSVSKYRANQTESDLNCKANQSESFF